MRLRLQRAENGRRVGPVVERLNEKTSQAEKAFELLKDDSYTAEWSALVVEVLLRVVQVEVRQQLAMRVEQLREPPREAEVERAHRLAGR